MTGMKTQHSFSTAEEKFYVMTDFLASEHSKALDLSGIEEYLFQEGRTLLRHLLCAHLAERGVGDIGPSVVGSDGIKRTHKRPLKRTIKTLFGPLEIIRLAYSKPSFNSLFPLDAMLNLPCSNLSYTLQKHLILEIIEKSFHKSCESLQRWTGVTITNRQAQKVIIAAASEFQNFYYTRCQKEADDARICPLLVLTSDGKGVMVKIEDLRPATRQKALRKKQTNTKRLFQVNHQYSKRMATVASVYEIDRYIRQPCDVAADFFAPNDPDKDKVVRPSPYAKRLWASLKDPAKSVLTDIFHEALQRDPDASKEWVILVDGDLNQIKQFQQLSQTFHVSSTPTIVCDIIHVLSYLWKAGHALQSKENIIEWVHEKLLGILKGKSSLVARGIRRSATCRHLTESEREPVDVCARYLINHAPYLKYHTYLKKGYPIATGIIEGACRYLVKDRMEITGARWSLQGAEALLKLRAVHASNDFFSYWEFYEQKQYEKNYQILYKHPEILQKKKLSKNPS